MGSAGEMKGPVAVTGAAGYVGSWLVMRLLQEGYTIRATVRDPSSGWLTLQFIRDPAYSKGFMSARTVTGFLSDVYPAAADEVGKIYLIADERVQGAVFDLPEEIARELLTKQTPPGNTLSKITKLPVLQDDGPPSDNYGRFSNRGRSFRGGSRERGGFRGSHVSGGTRDSDDEDVFRRKGRNYRTDNSWSRNLRRNGDDWLIGSRRSNRSSSFVTRERSFGGACFNCGQSGHRASECPDRQTY